jgi:hypothetical protein
MTAWRLLPNRRSGICVLGFANWPIMAMCGFLLRANRCTMVKVNDNLSPQVTIAS